MSIGNMPMIEQTTAMRDGLASGKVRALIAKHLGVAIERVTDDAHFADDLGADWLDRVELVIAIEDQFVGVEITDDDVDRMTGKTEELAGKLQERYGWTRERANDEINRRLSEMDRETTRAAR